MEEIIPCAVKDQEVFQRVWQRVMAGRDEAQCPIAVIPPHLQGDLSCDCLEALLRHQGDSIPPECQHWEQMNQSSAQQPGWQPVEDMPTPEARPEPEAPMPEAPMPEAPAEPQPEPEAPVPEPQPEPEAPMPEPQPEPEAPVPEPRPEPEAPMPEPRPEPEAPVPEAPCVPPEPDKLPPEDGPHRDNDLPQLWEAPRETPDRTTRLRQQVMESLEGWQFYRHLARRVRGPEARVLNGLAGEQHRQARKLSAAYFLLTGLRYWPSELLATPVIQSYWGALRQRHQAEQRQETAFRIAADDWDDPDLLALYAELIEACQRRCQQLRALLERDET